MFANWVSADDIMVLASEPKDGTELKKLPMTFIMPNATNSLSKTGVVSEPFRNVTLSQPTC